MISIVGLHVMQGQTEIQKVEARIIFDDDFYIHRSCMQCISVLALISCSSIWLRLGWLIRVN